MRIIQWQKEAIEQKAHQYHNVCILLVPMWACDCYNFLLVKLIHIVWIRFTFFWTTFSQIIICVCFTFFVMRFALTFVIVATIFSQRSPSEVLKRPQSIIISGESGAGKTETARHIVKFLSDSAKQELMNILNYASTILNTFGNATTAKNSNSSRYAKFIEVCLYFYAYFMCE